MTKGQEPRRRVAGASVPSASATLPNQGRGRGPFGIGAFVILSSLGISSFVISRVIEYFVIRHGRKRHGTRPPPLHSDAVPGFPGERPAHPQGRLDRGGPPGEERGSGRAARVL